MDRDSWHCTGDRDQDHPHGKEMQESKMAVWGGLTNSCEKKISKKQKRKGKISSVQSLSHVRLYATPWTAARQASLTITNSQSLLKLMSIDVVMPSNYFILCHPFLILVICIQSFPASRSFPGVSSLHQVVKVLEFQLQHQSFQWLFKTDFL